MNRVISAVAGRVRPRKADAVFKNRFGPSQFGILPPQALQLGRLFGRDPGPCAGIDLSPWKIGLRCWARGGRGRAAQRSPHPLLDHRRPAASNPLLPARRRGTLVPSTSWARPSAGASPVGVHRHRPCGYRFQPCDVGLPRPGVHAVMSAIRTRSCWCW